MKENNRKPVKHTIIFTTVTIAISLAVMALISEFTWRTFILSVVGIVWGISMLIMGLGFYYFFLRFRTSKCSAHTIAEFINYYPVGVDAPAEVYEFRFNANGHEVIAGTVMSEDLYAKSPIGVSVDLWYDPDDPSVCIQTKDPKTSKQLTLYKKLLVYGAAVFIVCPVIFMFA